ncbi:hypothetical protein NM208_g13581 [Fusarium decemcellulare]|uniref:Uncharacterized protein n=1 Tax=Fusarium decemcellulare TaxID=57161 RepID=A0ACC1RL84_9HYPO|nr:hypothetical protein NM208_g13581 [Fusarium decemcellulare]
MASALFKIGLSVVVLLAVFFQVFLKEAIWLGLGIGKVTQPLSDFPYTCRKIVDARMEACEDMWFSESTRQLFLACSDPLARPQWMPNVGRLNVSGRSQKDSIVALDVDKPIQGSFELRTLKTPGFSGTAGDGLLNLVGFAGIDSSDSDSDRVELLVINLQPSVDAEGKIGDQYVNGPNSTIELFQTGAGATELKHVRTYAHGQIATPNRVAALSRDAFYVTNDHGPHKLGPLHHLAFLLKAGNAVFCEAEKGCRTVAGGMKFPNGLARDKDGLVYIPCSLTGTITVFRPLPDHSLEKIDVINTGYSLDNISIDANGDLWVAAFPAGFDTLTAYNDPLNSHPAATALRVRKVEGKWVVEKVIEDAEGEVLPVATTVIHDVKTGRLFFSSVISPSIAVCDPKA